jgi:carboxylesterase
VRVSRSRLIVPGGESFLLPGGPTACLLVHGYTAFPEEMRELGDHLAAGGCTVLGLRLPGHGTHPRDLARVRWTDWVAAIEDGIAIVRSCERVVLVGQSLGAAAVLVAAARVPVAGAVALSAPYMLGRPRRGLRRMVRKAAPAHTELGVRREAGYPAYAAESPRAEREIGRLVEEMRASLASIDAPVVSSENDPFFPAEHGRRIVADLRDGQFVALEGLGHSLVLDPRRAEVFAAIDAFVAGL